MSDDVDVVGHRERAGIAWRGLWPVLTVGLLLLAFAVWQDARFPSRLFPLRPEPTEEQLAALKAGRIPNATGWVDWCLFFFIAWFLVFKSNVMARRFQLDPFDWLACSLILTNLSFSWLYNLALAGGLFPYWFASHNDAVWAVQNCLRAALVASLAASSWFLVVEPGPDAVRWPWVHRYLAPVLVAGSAGLLWWAGGFVGRPDVVLVALFTVCAITVIAGIVVTRRQE